MQIMGVDRKRARKILAKVTNEVRGLPMVEDLPISVIRGERKHRGVTRRGGTVSMEKGKISSPEEVLRNRPHDQLPSVYGVDEEPPANPILTSGHNRAEKAEWRTEVKKALEAPEAPAGAKERFNAVVERRNTGIANFPDTFVVGKKKNRISLEKKVGRHLSGEQIDAVYVVPEGTTLNQAKARSMPSSIDIAGETFHRALSYNKETKSYHVSYARRSEPPALVKGQTDKEMFGEHTGEGRYVIFEWEGKTRTGEVVGEYNRAILGEPVEVVGDGGQTRKVRPRTGSEPAGVVVQLGDTRIRIPKEKILDDVAPVDDIPAKHVAEILDAENRPKDVGMSPVRIQPEYQNGEGKRITNWKKVDVESEPTVDLKPSRNPKLRKEPSIMEMPEGFHIRLHNTDWELWEKGKVTGTYPSRTKARDAAWSKVGSKAVHVGDPVEFMHEGKTIKGEVVDVESPERVIARTAIGQFVIERTLDEKPKPLVTPKPLAVEEGPTRMEVRSQKKPTKPAAAPPEKPTAAPVPQKQTAAAEEVTKPTKTKTKTNEMGSKPAKTAAPPEPPASPKKAPTPASEPPKKGEASTPVTATTEHTPALPNATPKPLVLTAEKKLPNLIKRAEKVGVTVTHQRIHTGSKRNPKANILITVKDGKTTREFVNNVSAARQAVIEVEKGKGIVNAKPGQLASKKAPTPTAEPPAKPAKKAAVEEIKTPVTPPRAKPEAPQLGTVVGQVEPMKRPPAEPPAKPPARTNEEAAQHAQIQKLASDSRRTDGKAKPVLERADPLETIEAAAEVVKEAGFTAGQRVWFAQSGHYYNGYFKEIARSKTPAITVTTDLYGESHIPLNAVYLERPEGAPIGGTRSSIRGRRKKALDAFEDEGDTE
jgi:hypothetical protein